MSKPTTVDEYIASFPADIQKKLKAMRSTIRKAAPKADEVISYGIPAYKYKGMLAYFAAHTHHIGFYPAPRTSPEFKKELSAYKGGKGTVQFPFENELPLPLITRMIKFRVSENEKKDELKKLKKK